MDENALKMGNALAVVSLLSNLIFVGMIVYAVVSPSKEALGLAQWSLAPFTIGLVSLIGSHAISR